jgi:hypothetical protein
MLLFSFSWRRCLKNAARAGRNEELLKLLTSESLSDSFANAQPDGAVLL